MAPPSRMSTSSCLNSASVPRSIAAPKTRQSCIGRIAVALAVEVSGEVPRFLLATNEIAMWDLLSEEDGPAPPPTPPRAVGSALAEALEALDRYRWFRLLPMRIHPELAAEIEAGVLARGGEKALARWRERLSRWAR